MIVRREGLGRVGHEGDDVAQRFPFRAHIVSNRLTIINECVGGIDDIIQKTPAAEVTKATIRIALRPGVKHVQVEAQDVAV